MTHSSPTRRSLLAALFAAAAGGVLRAASSPKPQTPTPTPSVSVPLFQTPAGWLVPATVNGTPTLLLLDTGSTVTALDARLLRLKRSGRRAVTLLGSGSEERAVLQHVTLALGADIGAARIETVDVDLAHLRRACDCEVAGLVGMNFLAQFAELHLRLPRGSAPGSLTLVSKRAAEVTP